MGISIKTRKMLWGRAASRCAFPDCRRELVMDATETDDESVVGEECHIIAQEDKGPRGDSILTEEQRDKYLNLILLCNVHHKLVDDQRNYYSVVVLQQLKQEHEKWVRQSLAFDMQRQREEEIYASYIEDWTKLIELDDWNAWSSWVLGGGRPQIRVGIYKKLDETREWLLSRIWPKRYPEVEDAFENFRRVLMDFVNTFAQHSESNFGKDDDYMLRTEKIYKIDEWNPELYDELFKEFEYHVDLVQDLMLELTRAANYVCDKAREFILPSFRLKEGVLLVTSGPFMDLSYHTNRAEYRGEERTSRPYPGLIEYKRIRTTRDLHFGSEDEQV